MKKIPTLFKREFEGHKVVRCLNEVTPGMEWVLDGEGEATIKWDGSCCAIINGELYKRYDAKKGKKPPEGAIPCCDPDPVTGHWPHWVKVDKYDPANRWFIVAYYNLLTEDPLCFPAVSADGTYEAVGRHFNGNPYNKNIDYLVKHGTQDPRAQKPTPERSYDGIYEYLKTHKTEGLVFWKDGEPKCKIKRSDFGLPWPATDLPENQPFAGFYKEREYFDEGDDGAE